MYACSSESYTAHPPLDRLAQFLGTGTGAHGGGGAPESLPHSDNLCRGDVGGEGRRTHLREEVVHHGSGALGAVRTVRETDHDTRTQSLPLTAAAAQVAHEGKEHAAPFPRQAKAP